ncbi:hypothetical protein ACFFF5_16090 [Lederbergia wuyishanensis]|uniref:Uncharacterized protein n=1 Tax=Lederbergia wuyishanensis TaxID=1347903 RepID=A0ABU0D5V6_9BACI|nr:hypothetical protein [Lederbergia wuyishanensis]MCJ8008375.1 hypothetical protein [Lederbergia wuyishanensis]MDQ0343789.1 hypothetical protein [Lederbergia wuyishanensis]
MKKYVTIVGLMIVILAIPFFIWLWTPSTSYQVVIMDKAEPMEKLPQHSGIIWLLNHYKLKKENGDPYRTNLDYYGAIRDKKGDNVKLRHFPSDLKNSKLIYLADASGFTTSDQQLASGVSKEEWTSITEHVQNNESTLVTEYNILSSPKEAAVQKAITDFYQIQWSGWTGRYFEDLTKKNSDIPKPIIQTYEKNIGEWNFDGAGYILVNESEDAVVVLDKKHGEIGDGKLHLSFSGKGESTFNMKASPSFYGWFEIVKTNNEENVLASFSWNLTDKGKETVNKYDIPNSFPAIINKKVNNSDAFYFAGDFSYLQNAPATYSYAGLEKIKSALTFESFFPESSFFWKTYVPMMKKIMKEGVTIHKKEHPVTYEEKDNVSYRTRIHNDAFEVYVDGKWEPIMIKGVNLGMGKPGYFPGEAAITEEEYYRWFEDIGKMNANTIRVYTLHPPDFYRALKRYNESHENPLYILHGVWIDEGPLEKTLDAYTPEIVDEFQAEYKKIVDVIHGNKVVTQKPGHAFGNYQADISPYVVGWVIGIEWYPYMVDQMTTKYKDQPDFNGSYVYTEDGNGMEQWLAWQLDELSKYEIEHYKAMRPISFTNWVSTDLLNHPAEPSNMEDMATVNPNHLKTKSIANEVGMFASYHVYPYYPDFLNLEEKYSSYIDHRGQKNNYAGYLHDLKKAHDMPILIAEYGLPASRGLTHVNPFGWNQGFLTEKEQGEYLVHLYEDIREEGMLGGLIFTWQDEWFKRTWNTMDFDNPDRRPYWSNAQTNEQQFGLLSFDQLKIKIDGDQSDWDGIEPVYSKPDQQLQQVFMNHDEKYVYIRMDVEKLDDSSIVLLFDVNTDQGNKKISSIPQINLSFGADYLLKIEGKEKGELLVNSYYDTFLYQYGIQLKMLDPLPKQPIDNSGTFNPIRYALNKKMVRPDTNEILPFESYETGKLRHGNGNPDSKEYDSLADYYINEEKGIIEIRIPWLLLNVKDPSQREVMGDLYETGMKGSKETDGISISALLLDKDNHLKESFPQVDPSTKTISDPYKYQWEKWDMPVSKERLKQSYDIVKKFFSTIN